MRELTEFDIRTNDMEWIFELEIPLKEYLECRSRNKDFYEWSHGSHSGTGYEYYLYKVSVKLRESFKTDQDAIYKTMNFYLYQYSKGVMSVLTEEQRFGDFRGSMSQRVSNMKTHKEKIQMCASIFGYFINPMLRDGDTTFHVIGIFGGGWESTFDKEQKVA